MKISRIIDKEVDKSEIESRYIWYRAPQGMNRIDLLTFTVDLCLTLDYYQVVIETIAIPEDYFYGVMNQSFGDCYSFISDPKFKIKKIKHLPEKAFIKHISNCACFYDDSIFKFEYSSHWSTKCVNRRAKRYLIKENKWIYLCASLFEHPVNCIGLNQKIIISTEAPGKEGIYIYDLILDSYSHHFPIKNYDEGEGSMMAKCKGKIYMIILSTFYRTYSCENPLSEWDFICEFKENLFCYRPTHRVYFGGSIYYLTLLLILLKIYEIYILEVEFNIMKST